ncbi:MAG: hypothetical protein ACFCGT_04030 [Sandaracinaceae bacterium]
MLNLRPLVHGLISLAAYMPLIVASGCGSGGNPTGDGGVPDDDGGGVVETPFACSAPVTLEGILDETVSVTVDTEVDGLRPRDLGLACGNVDPQTLWAPQTVVAYAVPGTGDVEVSFTTANSGTDGSFDTVVQVRTECEAVPSNVRFPEPTCFENSAAGTAIDPRSEGAVLATGGETLFFVVTGFSDSPAGPDRGEVRLDVSARANSRPQVTGGQALVLDNTLTIVLEGQDPESNLRGLIVDFRNPDGIVPLYDGLPPALQILTVDEDGGALRTLIGQPADGPSSFPLYLDLPSTLGGIDDPIDIPQNILMPFNGPPLGDIIENSGTTQLGVRVYDSSFAISELVLIDLEEGSFVGFGEACGGAALCAPPLVCDGTCGASAGAEDTCTNPDSGNPVIDLNEEFLIEQETFSQFTVEGEIPGGPSAFAAPTCIEASQGEATEAVYSFTLPPGLYDVILDTDTDVTGDADTVMQLRADCLNDTLELACSDDIAEGANLASRIEQELGAGTYWVLLERFTTQVIVNRLPFAMDVTIRPVKSLGEACDPGGVLDRCGAGSCQGGVCQP